MGSEATVGRSRAEVGVVLSCQQFNVYFDSFLFLAEDFKRMVMGVSVIGILLTQFMPLNAVSVAPE